MPTIISVASGKGGVGKSSLAVNMSTRLQDGYGPTLLVDSDLLMANSHVLLNTRPTVDLIDVLEVVAIGAKLSKNCQMACHCCQVVPQRTSWRKAMLSD